jgi:hypothetical protein
VGGQHHAPAVLPPVRTRYPLYRRLSWPQGRSGRVRKISPQPGSDLRTAKAVASRYIILYRCYMFRRHLRHTHEASTSNSYHFTLFVIRFVNGRLCMPSWGFEPAITAIEWPQTYALDRGATGIGHLLLLPLLILPSLLTLP